MILTVYRNEQGQIDQVTAKAEGAEDAQALIDFNEKHKTEQSEQGETKEG